MMTRAQRIIAISLLCGIYAGCYPERENSPTSGTLHILVAESVAPPVIQQVESFLDIYAERGARITYTIVTSVDAVDGFVQDTFQVAVTVDSLTAGDYESVDNMDGSFLVRTSAFDGIAVVSHPENPFEVLRTTQLRDILHGTTTRWEDLHPAGPRGSIEPVIQGSSDISRFLTKTVLRGNPIAARMSEVQTSKEVLREVLRNQFAIGFVGTSWLDSAGQPLHQIKIHMDHPEEESWYPIHDEARGLAFTAHQANILRGYYPLSRRVYLLSRAELGGDLATGFGAYILNSAGQRIFFDHQMIPATQTIRLQ
jgi:ABC-type phosphate transport system substrate-binding protein